ncbi:sulfatase [Myxococcota bacterium]|nr:sulfatase [Myxococcota bacterium]
MSPNSARGARVLALGVLLLSVPLLAAVCRRSPGPARLAAGETNVVLIVVDTLRADHLGAWGYPHPTSPVLDRLAAEGVRFSRWFSNSPWTRPGMATLLTGLYPRTTGIFEEKFDALSPDLTTLAERLKARGYTTLGVTANPNVNAWFGFDQGFDAYGDCGVVWKWMPKDRGERAFRRGKTDMETADSLTDRALQVVDRHRAALKAGPFFLQALYIDPHWPYVPPDADREAVAGSDLADYDGEVRFADREVGRLLEGLRERGVMEDTLVVVTSDHGEGLKDHPSVPHSSTHGSILYDSALHVPMILHHPALPRGKVVDDLVSSIDFVPTLLGLLGISVAEGELPGRSLAPLALGAGPVPGLPDRIFAETDWRVNRKVAVRTGSHKYIRNDDSRAYQADGTFEGRTLADSERRLLTVVPREELYRVGGGVPEDPKKSDVYEREAAAAPPLIASLEGWERAVPVRSPLRRDPEDVVTTPAGVVPAVPPGEAGGAVLDADTASQLRALGYLGEEGSEGEPEGGGEEGGG